MLRSDDDLVSGEENPSPADEQPEPSSLDGLPVVDSLEVDSAEIAPEYIPDYLPEGVDDSLTGDSFVIEADSASIDEDAEPGPDSLVSVESAEPEAEIAPVSEVVSRIELLTLAVERYPEAPVNYVLRGEVLLDHGDFELAAHDFERAVMLADPNAETANWGYINRALADRAREGLRRCRVR
jgi:hypothetical protein